MTKQEERQEISDRIKEANKYLRCEYLTDEGQKLNIDELVELQEKIYEIDRLGKEYQQKYNERSVGPYWVNEVLSAIRKGVENKITHWVPEKVREIKELKHRNEKLETRLAEVLTELQELKQKVNKLENEGASENGALVEKNNLLSKQISFYRELVELQQKAITQEQETEYQAQIQIPPKNNNF